MVAANRSRAILGPSSTIVGVSEAGECRGCTISRADSIKSRGVCRLCTVVLRRRLRHDHPTALAYQRQSPYLGGRDLAGEIVEAAHAVDIKVLGMIDLGQ